MLHLEDRAVYRTNDVYRHNIDISIITDGKNHVLDLLHPSFSQTYTHITTNPKSSKHLGFEAQKYLASNLEQHYDLYCYLEDDLIIHDALFFNKLSWFSTFFGTNYLLLPHRYEFPTLPDIVDRLYIDGPIAEAERRSLQPLDLPVQVIDWYGDKVPFTPPQNPHAGCFFLKKEQLQFWKRQSCWQDGDVSFISPLESSATLGIAKVFNLYKPCLTHAGWLQLQHYGNSFHCLINKSSSVS